LGLKENIDFKWTSGPVLTKTPRFTISANAADCEQPEVQNYYRATQLKKLFEKTMMVALGSEDAADDAGVSLPAERIPIQRAQAGNPGVRQSRQSAGRTGDNPQIKSSSARSKGLPSCPREIHPKETFSNGR